MEFFFSPSVSVVGDRRRPPAVGTISSEITCKGDRTAMPCSRARASGLPSPHLFTTTATAVLAPRPTTVSSTGTRRRLAAAHPPPLLRPPPMRNDRARFFHLSITHCTLLSRMHGDTLPRDLPETFPF